jgi:cell division septation protein DedD
MDVFFRRGALPLVAAALVLAAPSAATAAPAHRQACKPAADKSGDWEVSLGHGMTRKAASSLRAKVTAKGLKAVVESDGCGKFEVAIEHMKSQSSAGAMLAKATKDGFKAVVEKS